jgi:hypothetical protein
MGRFFTSFDEGWEFFLGRDEELEDFFARFPEEDGLFLGWLIRLDPSLVPAAQEAQGAFSHLDWITTVPGHFLHTWIAGTGFSDRPSASEIAALVERAERAWLGVEPFEVVYRRINCFHDAIVAEVEGDGPRALLGRLVDAGYWGELPVAGGSRAVQMDTFLPHVTLGVFNRAHAPAELRTALTPLRDDAIGRQSVRDVTLCAIGLSRAPMLRPWQVVGSVTLG